MRNRLASNRKMFALFFALLLGVGCASQPVAPAAVPPSAPTPTVVWQPSILVEPGAQTIPAGASASFALTLPEAIAGAAQWSVLDVPAGVTTEFQSSANPANVTLVVQTMCALPAGRITLNVQAVGAEKTYRAPVALDLAGRLADAPGGTFTGSFAENTLALRRGGPTTLQTGPFTVLQFCESASPRALAVVVESATSDAGTPLRDPVRFALFRSFVYPVPDFLQTMGGGYRANAFEVAQSRDNQLGWNVMPGVYLLVFQRSPLEDARAAEQRPAAVRYRIQVTP